MQNKCLICSKLSNINEYEKCNACLTMLNKGRKKVYKYIPNDLDLIAPCNNLPVNSQVIKVKLILGKLKKGYSFVTPLNSKGEYLILNKSLEFTGEFID